MHTGASDGKQQTAPRNSKSSTTSSRTLSRGTRGLTQAGHLAHMHHRGTRLPPNRRCITAHSRHQHHQARHNDTSCGGALACSALRSMPTMNLAYNAYTLSTSWPAHKAQDNNPLDPKTHILSVDIVPMSQSCYIRNSSIHQTNQGRQQALGMVCKTFIRIPVLLITSNEFNPRHTTL